MHEMIKTYILKSGHTTASHGLMFAFTLVFIFGAKIEVQYISESQGVSFELTLVSVTALSL